MTAIIDTRDDFDLDNFRRVAWEGEPVRITERAVEKMKRARKNFMALLNSDPSRFIYGVTTAYGEGARERLDDEGRRHQAQAPADSMGCGLGKRLPERVVRGMIFARLTNFIEGYSAVSPEIAQKVADMLDGRPVPEVPLEGQAAAGELHPLFSVFHHLIGAECAEKDGNCLMNGAPCAAALVADLALRSRNRLRLAEHVFALSIEAANAPLEPYDPALTQLWDDSYDAAAIDELSALLRGARTKERRSFQAPVSWRIIPRVLGQAHRAVAAVEDVARISLRSITDNPVYLPPDPDHPNGYMLHNGGFHNNAAYGAMGALSTTWADLTALSSRHTTKLHRPEVTGLSLDLRKGDSIFSTHGLMVAHISFAQKARDHAAPTFIPLDEPEDTQSDLTTPTFYAYEKELNVARCLDVCLAILAATASQALWVAERQPATPLRQFLAAIRTNFEPVETIRNLGFDVEVLANAFSESAMTGDFTLGNGAPGSQADSSDPSERKPN